MCTPGRQPSTAPSHYQATVLDLSQVPLPSRVPRLFRAFPHLLEPAVNFKEPPGTSPSSTPSTGPPSRGWWLSDSPRCFLSHRRCPRSSSICHGPRPRVVKRPSRPHSGPQPRSSRRRPLKSPLASTALPTNHMPQLSSGDAKEVCKLQRTGTATQFRNFLTACAPSASLYPFSCI